MSLPQFEFTGTAFTVTFSWYSRRTAFRATVGSAQPSDWSTSELSEPIERTGPPERRFLR